MLSKQAQRTLLKALKLTDDAIATLVDTDDECDVELPAETSVFTAAELVTHDSSKYSAGRDAGVETAMKEFKRANNLDFKGKTLQDLHDYLTANMEDADAVKQLRDDVTTLTTERDTMKTELSALRLQTKIHAFIPDLNNGMNKAEAISVMQANGFDFREEEGAIVAYRHGSKLIDADEQTMAAEEAIINFFEAEKKWTGDIDALNSGRTGGGGSNSSVKARPTYARTSEVEKAFNTRYGPGASMGTEHDFAGHLQKIMKEAEAAGTPLLMD